MLTICRITCLWFIASLCSLQSARAAEQVFISEFMAANDGVLADEDGDFPDWVEIHNTAAMPLDLNGWFLTDRATELTRWRFPATNLAPDACLIVFASGKDRRGPGAPLHTCFKLDSAGEYLALVKPDGLTIASEFSPSFPPQAPGISFGLPAQQTNDTLVAAGALARVRVPTNGLLGAAWTMPGFDDSAWDLLATGVGFESDPPTIEVVADSVADWSLTGAQGWKSWYYGYYDATADIAGPGYRSTDFTPFPRGAGAFSANNFWNGAEWRWWNGRPPFDQIGQRLMNPNGAASGAEHWVIRRWLSQVEGAVLVEWTVAKPAGDGDGVVVQIFHQGELKASVALPTASESDIRRTNSLANVRIGDSIDIVVSPGGSGDEGDRCLVSATIRGNPSVAGAVTSSLQASMRGVNASAYLRLPFTVSDPAAVEFLTLRMKYDDGFIAYLNGQEISRAQAPGLVAWNSSATASRLDADAVGFAEFNVTAGRELLHTGTNLLAIHGLNAGVNDGDFLILPELIASRVTREAGEPRYFMTPTPGAPNGLGVTNVGPLILSAGHSPNFAGSSEAILVTARVAPTFGPVGGVNLIYRVMYGGEVTVPMLDDGAHGDGAADDGVFGTAIPAGAAAAGQMVRYCVVASDDLGASSRFPAFEDPKNSPEYLGTVVLNPALTNPLPVFHLFVQDPVAATNSVGARGSAFYDGEFYDNVGIDVHGQTTTDVFPKRSMNIDFNRGFKFRWDRNLRRVSAVILLSTSSDKAYLRTVLAMESFREIGVPSFFALPVRLQQNGSFHGVMHLVERGDDDFLQRNGLASDGALYKIYDLTNSPYAGAAEKKTRRNEDNSDLQALIDGVRLTGAARRQFLYDHLDIPECVNFLATMQAVQSEDCCDKNYYLFRDTAATGEWQLLPWDVDLTFGREFVDWHDLPGGLVIGGYYDTFIHATNLYYWQLREYLDYIGNDNLIGFALFDTPEIHEMFQRRWSTVQERLLQPPGTPAPLLRYERRVDELAAQMAPDAALDYAVWGPWCPPAFSPQKTLADGVEDLKFDYFEPRRDYIFNVLRHANGGPYLGPQPTNALLRFGALESNPDSTNQDQEFIQILNPNNYPVDLSGWKVIEGIQHTFKPGTVLPSRGSIYLSPDVKAFRARAAGPRGGQGLFVQGNYQGRLSARGDFLQLITDSGRTVATTSYPGRPSPAQQYLRITEIMYHPAAAPPGGAFAPDEFEYIELKNIGPVNLSLLGVRLVSGVEFDFTRSAVTNLLPGQRVLIVKNPNAFASRHGNALLVAGAYTGSLENQGEKLRLVDAANEEILEFAYDNQWYSVTDGRGFSLVIADENAHWRNWKLKRSWRASGSPRGSPGSVDPLPASVPPIVISEILTHPILPGVEAVELFNPTALPANVGGWFLSDDFSNPRKYRLPDATLLAAGGFLVLTENEFNRSNPASLTAFALSPAGGSVWLFSASASGEITGWSHGVSFGGAEPETSFGRHFNSAGGEQFVAQSAPSLAAPNLGPKVGPIVIAEIHYHPPDRADGSDNSDDEYVELQNLTASAVPLFDPDVATNTWRLRGTVDFNFPPQLTLPAAGILLIVSFDPADPVRTSRFRARFNVPPTVPLLGPFAGNLDNASGDVKLDKPGAPINGGVPRILVDRVQYADQSPWPPGADGTGLTLQRIIAAAFGDDPANWRATPATAGSATLNCITTISPAATSFASLGGSADILLTSAIACPWTILNTNPWIHLLSPASGVGSATITLSVDANPGAAARQTALVIDGQLHPVAQFGAESTPPVMTITTPPNNTRVSSDLVSVRGTARDNTGVRRVEYLAGSALHPASGPPDWAVWSVDLPLVPGTNFIQVRALDLAGNYSPPVSRLIYRVATNRLTALASPAGRGNTTPALNGASLEVGRGYSLTATPAAGWLFSNWVSSVDGVIGSTPPLKFIMNSNLTLTANFVANPFLATRGSYSGLFDTSGPARHESAGAFNLLVTDRGAYSGKFWLAGKAYPIAGKFDLDGRATNRVSVSAAPAVKVEWRLYLIPGADAIDGRVVRETLWTATLTGARAGFNAATNKATNFAGKYTLVMPGQSDAAAGPEGDGIATVAIDLAGNATVLGTLADNTPFTLKVALAKDGRWPAYLPLYGGRGFWSGWVTISNEPARSLSGTASWVRPPLPPSPFYPGGFATNAFTVIGSGFVAPYPASSNLLPFARGTVEFLHGHLSASVSNVITVLPNNRVTNNGPGLMTLTLTPASGLFSGTAALPDLPKPAPFKGVWLPSALTGRGFFVGTNVNGAVRLQPE